MQKLKQLHREQLLKDADAERRLRERPFLKIQSAGTLVEASDGSYSI